MAHNILKDGSYIMYGPKVIPNPFADGNNSGGSPWSWAGENPTLAQSYGPTKVYLKDTAFASWTPTTTSTKFSDAANLAPYEWDRSNYDYLVLLKWHAHFEYGSESTGKIQISDQYAFYAYDVIGYSGTLSGITTGTDDNQGAYTCNPLLGGIFYKNDLGIDSYALSANYGIFPNSAAQPTLNATTITPKVPQINARCNSTYFSTTNAEAVDQNSSYYEYKVELWQVDKHTSNNGYNMNLIRDTWLNGMS